MRASFKFDGLLELIDELRKPREAKTKAVLQYHTQEVARKATQAVPKRTHFLERSQQVEVGESEASVRYTAHYSGYVELGTRFMDAQPYLFPAHRGQEDQFIKDITKALAGGD